MIKKKHDALAGLFFVACGVWYLWTSLTELEIGTAFHMGAGYAPTVLSSAIILFGIIFIGTSFRGPNQNLFLDVPWRPIVCICAAMLVFGLSLRSLGLFPATAAASFLSSLARPLSPIFMIATAVGVGVFCTIVFGVIIGLPVSLIGSL